MDMFNGMFGKVVNGMYRLSVNGNIYTDFDNYWGEDLEINGNIFDIA